MGRANNLQTKDLKNFGTRLAKVRVSKGYSQESLADESKIAYSTINKLENGILNTGINTVFILAKTLKVPAKDLFDF